MADSELPSSTRVIANGLPHHVLVWEPSENARGVVFLLHGYMDAAGTWSDVAPMIAARGYRTIAPDFRGFGAGARVPAGAYYHFADYVFDIADIVRAFAPSESALPMFVVGHSMGGTVATLFTGSFPERVTKLALLEGLGPPQMPDDVAPLRVKKWIEDVRKIRQGENAKSQKPMTEDEALARLAMNHARIDKSILRKQIPHLTTRSAEGLSWAFDPLHKTPSPTPYSAHVFGAFARAITCPTLFVSGGAHGFHPPDEEARLAWYRDLTRREMPTAGHMMHWTEPQTLAEILLEFLA